MRALFLTTQTLIEEHWWSVAYLIDPVVHQAARGEFTIEDLADMVTKGHAIAGLAFDDETQAIPTMAIVFEFRSYPRKTVLNVMALGGRDLPAVANSFWPQFVTWAKESGASEIEACTSPAMTRVLKGIGFAHTYDIVRYPVGEQS